MRYTTFVRGHRKKQCYSRGFTLVELLVAITVFTIFITILISVFTSFIQFQSISQNERQAIDTLAGAVDTISREARLGHDYRCGREVASASGRGREPECRCFVFKDQLGREVEYRWRSDKERLEKKINRLEDARDGCGLSDSGAVESTDGWVPATDKSIALGKVLFYIDGGSSNIQPRARVFFNGTYVVEGKDRSITLSTQVTQRVLDLGSTQDKLKNLILGTNTISSAASIAYVYGDDGVCYDELGSGQGDGTSETNCDFEKEIKDVVYVHNGGNSYELYILTTDGFVFFVTNSDLNNLFSTQVSNDRIEVTTRVVGMKSGGSCRRRPRGKPGSCLNDPQRIKSIYSAFKGENHVVYALSDDGNLYGIKKNKGTRLLKGISKIEKIITGEEFSTKAKKRIVLYTQDGNKIAIFNGSIGENDVLPNNEVRNADVSENIPGTFLGVVREIKNGGIKEFGLLEYEGENSDEKEIKDFRYSPSRPIVCQHNKFNKLDRTGATSFTIKDLAYWHGNSDDYLYLLGKNGFVYKSNNVTSCSSGGSKLQDWEKVTEGIKDLFPTKVERGDNFIYAFNGDGNLIKIDTDTVTVFNEGDNRFLDQPGEIGFTQATSFINNRQFLVGTYEDESGQLQKSLFAHENNDTVEPPPCSIDPDSQASAGCVSSFDINDKEINKEVRRFEGECVESACTEEKKISIYKFNIKIVEAKP